MGGGWAAVVLPLARPPGRDHESARFAIPFQPGARQGLELRCVPELPRDRPHRRQRRRLLSAVPLLAGDRHGRRSYLLVMPRQLTISCPTARPRRPPALVCARRRRAPRPPLRA